ncbi:MAG: DUF1697 domain-containing protein [Saprospiraceae bacterium]|nr:DUF1697 domain-containing protein [Saprospiraceae bacterium]
MQKFIALLRGINVNGKNLIKMETLRTVMESEGFQSVETYIQSGNILFDTNDFDEKKQAKRIQEVIKKEFGYEVPVLVLSTESLILLVDNNPFRNDPTKDKSFWHLTILEAVPSIEILGKINVSKYLPDEFILLENAIYLYCPRGYGQTKLTNNFWESKFNLCATTRNWKTLEKLINLANS